MASLQYYLDMAKAAKGGQPNTPSPAAGSVQTSAGNASNRRTVYVQAPDANGNRQSTTIKPTLPKPVFSGGVFADRSEYDAYMSSHQSPTYWRSGGL